MNKFIIEIGPNVLTIKTFNQVKEFVALFGVKRDTGYSSSNYGIDWSKVAEHFNGIEIINPRKLYKTHHWDHDELVSWLYTWDVSSGCIWDKDGIKKLSLSNQCTVFKPDERTHISKSKEINIKTIKQKPFNSKRDHEFEKPTGFWYSFGNEWLEFIHDNDMEERYFDDITITKKEAENLGILDGDGLGLVNKDIYKSINKQLLDLINSGEELPWRKPWRDGYRYKGVSYGPQNYVTGSPYRGANAFTMWLYNRLNNEESIYFLTKKQVQDRGGKVLPSAKPILVWAFIKGTEVKKDKDGNERTIEHKGIVSYYVYDLKHTEGVKPIKRKSINTDEKHEVIAEAQLIIDNMPKRPKITNDGGDRAYYAPYSDSVHMPVQKSFKQPQQYYSTLFHELVHSTGHEKRLKRDLTGKFGSKPYAFEELIAEIGAAYLCGVTNIEYYTLKNTAAYLKSWAKKLTSEIAQDKTFLFRAVLAATKAAKFIIGTTLDKHGEVVTEGEKLTENTKTYSDWENEVTEALENELEISRSDAQGLVEANEFELKQAWGKGLSASATAKQIIKKSEAKPSKKELNTEIENFNVSDYDGKIGALHLKKFQELKNSLQEGLLILKSGKKVTGKKMTAEELEAVERSIISTQNKIKELAEKTAEEAAKRGGKEEQEEEEQTPVKVTPKGDKPDFTGDIDYQTAYRAYYNTSFSPDKRAKSTIEDFAKGLENVYDEYMQAEDKTKALINFNEYRKASAQLYNKWLYSRSNLASSAIVGPAKFPVKRMEKLNRYADNHYNRYIEITEKLIKRHKIELGLTPDPSAHVIVKGSENAVERIKEKIAELEKRVEFSKQANKDLRAALKTSDASKYLLDKGYKPAFVSEILKPDYAGRRGVPQFMLTNMNAEIRRLKGRLIEEEKLNQKRETGNKEYAIKGGKLVENYEANRIQIYFDSMPDADTRSKLKSIGFKWAPSVKAWQNYLTENTKYKIRKFYPELVEGAKPVTTTKEEHYPGKEVTPNKAVKASVNAAINDLLTMDKYKNYGAMFLNMFYSTFKDSDSVESIEGKLKATMFKKYEFDLFEADNVDDEEITNATLTDSGKALIKAIEGRLNTLKAKKGGQDMFPELAGLSASLEFIRRYILLDGRVVSLDEIEAFISDLQEAIKRKTITKDDPHAELIREIQKKLVNAYNENIKLKHIEVTIKDKLKYEQELQGLGMLPEIISAAAGKAVEIVTKKFIQKDKGLGCAENTKCGCTKPEGKKEGIRNKIDIDTKIINVNGFAGVMSADKMGEVKYEAFKFNPYYKGIFGSPATNFDMCIYGDPGTGKTVFLLQLANYFAENFGPVLYVSTEEYGAATLIDKIKRFKTNSKNLFFSPKLIDPSIDLKKYKFIFLDSVNHAKVNLEQYKQIREENPNTVFVLILQTTKSGSYRGGKDWPHEVEISMKLYKDENGKRMLNIDKDRYGNPRTVKI